MPWDPRELDVLRAALDAEDAIDAATSAGDVAATKPAPDLVQVAFSHAGAAPTESVFIGAAAWDAQACQRGGVPSVGVLTGGWSRDSRQQSD